MSPEGISAPKQQRSRDSFARVKAAALALLQDPDVVEFTLADVSRLSGASIGSIYTRVQSKSDLIRAVQMEEFDRIDRAAQTISDRADSARDFEDAVTQIVRALIGHLVENAAILRAFMRLSAGDEQITVRGRQSSDISEAAFITSLLNASDRWHVGADLSAVSWCYDLIYSVVGRHLGFGIAAGGLPRDPIAPSELADRLSDTILSFLLRAGSASTKSRS
ncbi:TetR/AcrR family transcriptional regulator [Microbacterium sp. E-13]|uniref:TetR/AcrR family transcriptional regulator n=1 Tax=Microbacterium sp. E-13 TaxID=3404048 RepID=UPI003CFACEF3